jgi:beta-lactam-binding protein with PASTA domain
LQWKVVYRAARPGEQLGVVVGEKIPPRDVASAYSTIELTVPQARHGVVPNVVGLSLDQARSALARVHLHAQARGVTSGRVVAQSPAAGVAASTGMVETVTLKREKGG